MPVIKFRSDKERSEAKQKIFALYKDGVPVKEIGERLSITGSSVWYYLNQAGLVNRKHQKSKKFISVVNGEAKTQDATGIQVSFAAGYTRAWLEGYAREHGLPAGELVKSVTSILGEN